VGDLGVLLSSVVLLAVLIDFERSTIVARTVLTSIGVPISNLLVEYVEYYIIILFAAVVVSCLGLLFFEEFYLFIIVAVFEAFLMGVRKILVSRGFFSYSMVFDLFRSSGWVPFYILSFYIFENPSSFAVCMVWALWQILICSALAFKFSYLLKDMRNFKSCISLNWAWVKNFKVLIGSIYLVVIETFPRFLLDFQGGTESLALYVMYGGFVFPISIFMWIRAVGPNLPQIGMLHSRSVDSISRKILFHFYFRTFLRGFNIWILLASALSGACYFLFKFVLSDFYFSRFQIYLLMLPLPIMSFGLSLTVQFFHFEKKDFLNAVLCMTSLMLLIFINFLIADFRLEQVSLTSIVISLYISLCLDMCIRTIVIHRRWRRHGRNRASS
jgi:hypothetical protein